jgi:hypothetical protein
MHTVSFDSGAVQVGGASVPFQKKSFQGKYSVWVPSGFVEDKSLVSNYTYLYSPESSPLSIAIRYTQVSSPGDRAKMIQHHFSRGSGEGTAPTALGGAVFYRDTLAKGKDMSVYSLRFSVEVPGGVLFGCFTCSGTEQEGWKPVVLAMLANVEPVA